jgi:large subunit ribosomal protein L25
MAQAELRVSPRSVMGKQVKVLRRSGVIPGTISGHGVEPTHVQVNERELDNFLARQRGLGMLTLTGLGDAPRTVLLRAVDRVSTSGRVQHIEFQQVSQREKLHTDVALKFSGTAPAVSRGGGTLLTSLNHVRVECLPRDIPASITVDLSTLVDEDAAIHVRDIQAPPGVTITTPGDDLVAKVVASRIAEGVEEEQAEVAAAVAAPAPETAAGEPAAEGGAEASES